MINWIKRLFHHHEWVVIRQAENVMRDPYSNEMVTVGQIFYLRCSVCGKIKRTVP